MGAYRYVVRDASVVSEIIDGEAIIMDMSSGTYYSADGVGGLIWQAILDGASQEAILSAAQLAFPHHAEAVGDIAQFLLDIETRGLAQQSDGHGSAEPPIWTAPYAPPLLQVHEDMQDLIQLDPIHDVDQMGWPIRKTEG